MTDAAKPAHQPNAVTSVHEGWGPENDQRPEIWAKQCEAKLQQGADAWNAWIADMRPDRNKGAYLDASFRIGGFHPCTALIFIDLAGTLEGYHFRFGLIAADATWRTTGAFSADQPAIFERVKLEATDFRKEWEGQLSRLIFRQCTFRGNHSFTKLEKLGEPMFVTCTFDERAYFSGLKLDLAHFDGTKFGGETDFAKCVFWGPARFRHCRFARSANFNEATFLYMASFESSIFESDVSFASCKFQSPSGEATAFNGAVFEKHADLQGSRFAVLPRFEGASVASIELPDLSDVLPLARTRDKVSLRALKRIASETGDTATELVINEVELKVKSVDDLVLVTLRGFYLWISSGGRKAHTAGSIWLGLLLSLVCVYVASGNLAQSERAIKAPNVVRSCRVDVGGFEASWARALRTMIPLPTSSTTTNDTIACQNARLFGNEATPPTGIVIVETVASLLSVGLIFLMGLAARNLLRLT